MVITSLKGVAKITKPRLNRREVQGLSRITLVLRARYECPGIGF
jgi:hypothetical protein